MASHANEYILALFRRYSFGNIVDDGNYHAYLSALIAYGTRFEKCPALWLALCFRSVAHDSLGLLLSGQHTPVGELVGWEGLSLCINDLVPGGSSGGWSFHQRL